MKRLKSGSIVRIPLQIGLGYAYAKYIKLSEIASNSEFPEIVKVFNVFTTKSDSNLDENVLSEYLLSPILVAGLRPTIRKGLWQVVGERPMYSDDLIEPNFKDGGTTLEEIERGTWFIVPDGMLSKRRRSSYDEVKYLQPFLAKGTGNIEIMLTLYFLQLSGLDITKHYNVEDEYEWEYTQVKINPPLTDKIEILN